jgi:hypothetical protein
MKTPTGKSSRKRRVILPPDPAGVICGRYRQSGDAMTGGRSLVRADSGIVPASAAHGADTVEASLPASCVSFGNGGGQALPVAGLRQALPGNGLFPFFA